MSTGVTASETFAAVVKGPVATQNLEETSLKKYVVLGVSVVRHVDHANLHAKCFPGIHVEQLKPKLKLATWKLRKLISFTEAQRTYGVVIYGRHL